MRTRTALTAAALATAAALTLTACGDSDSGDDGGTEQIEGAKDSSSDAPKSPDAEEEAPEGAPDVSLPKDVELVFDWDDASKPDETAAQRDAQNYLRSIFRGVTEQSNADPAAQFYARDQALTYAQDQVEQSLEAGVTLTGTQRFYRLERETHATAVALSFCANQSEMFSKEVGSGKVLRTEESDSSFLYYRVVMGAYPGRDDVWQATNIEVETEATQCRG
ncbi:hypothetical protein [Streptomyces aculeolatus]|uniref:hypothetical protein n=1 Tax=Streptomyces aculeolatus TaxID=270689 RepID=UPI001CED1860|nr:hypothetical protein [Streptomyces aculeolatus]